MTLSLARVPASIIGWTYTLEVGTGVVSGYGGPSAPPPHGRGPHLAPISVS